MKIDPPSSSFSLSKAFKSNQSHILKTHPTHCQEEEEEEEEEEEMEGPFPSSRTSDRAIDASPLLTYSIADHLLRSRRIFRRHPPHLRGAAARLLRRASSRRMMLREPSVQVRENAAEQLEERQSDWAYSKPVTVLDVLWNLTFVAVSAAVLWLSTAEDPDVPLRLWILGYGLQCLFRVACVVYEYRRRRMRRRRRGMSSEGRSFFLWVSGDSSSGSGVDDGSGYETLQSLGEGDTSAAKHLESANTMFSLIWWVVGFYWVTVGGQNLTQDSPQLYWLCITFLAIDVVFVIICVAIACLIGIAVCCCLPCIIGVLYAMTDREGATSEEIDRLPKFKFRRVGYTEKTDGEIHKSCGGTMTECGTDTPSEHALTCEDAECCICLQAYDDETELRELPCHHHFHCMCIDKWLYINATCPLCKFNILKADNSSDSEEV